MEKRPDHMTGRFLYSSILQFNLTAQKQVFEPAFSRSVGQSAYNLNVDEETAVSLHSADYLSHRKESDQYGTLKK